MGFNSGFKGLMSVVKDITTGGQFEADWKPLSTSHLLHCDCNTLST